MDCNDKIALFYAQCVKSASKSKLKIPRTLKFQCFRDLFLYISLFHLNRPRRFARNIIEYSVNSVNFVDDS